jgi:formylglycine-generating enzyme required for sulfatase activity
MGVVYLVKDPSAAGREVALKLLRNEGGDPRMLERFLREAKMLASLRHPGIVKIRSTGWLNEGPFLLMDFVEGEPLDEKVREPMDPKEAARITRGVADAVAAMHAQGLLHRDIKPSNVLLRPDGSPILLDFGLARDTRAERLTLTGEVLGTPSYMSPEQADGGEPDAYGPPVDVWGLAALLFHLLTARAPYAGSPVRIIMDILDGPPPAPSKLEKGVPKALDAIVQKATRAEPSDRYEDAAAMREDLDRFLRGRAPVALEEFRPPGRGKKIAAAVLVLALLMVAGGAWAYSKRSKPATTEPTVSTFEAPKFRGSVRPTVTSQGKVLLTGSVRTEGPWAEVSLDDQGSPLRLEGGGDFALAATVSPLTTALCVRLRGPGGEAEPRWVPVAKAWPGWFRKLKAKLRPPIPLPEGLVVEEDTGDYRWKADGSLLRWIPPGEFVMGGKTILQVSLLGGNPDVELLKKLRGADTVRVKLTQGVFLGKYEMTWEKWSRYCRENERDLPNRAYTRRPESKRKSKGKKFQERKWKRLDHPVRVPVTHPVTGVRHEEVLDYCKWAKLRLPTEAEWERAARGGKETKFVWGDEFEEGITNCLGSDEYVFTSPVGTFERDLSEFGCFDMAGNVKERVADYYYPYPSGVTLVEDPTHPEIGVVDEYVLRGGSWALEMADIFQCSYRSLTARYHKRGDRKGELKIKKEGPEQIGFRVALSPNPKGK